MSRLLLFFLLHLLGHGLHGSLHLSLLLLLNDSFKLVTLSFHVLLVCCTHFVVHLGTGSMHCALPDLLAIIGNVPCLVTGLTNFLSELDKVIQGFVLIVDVVAELKPDFLSGDLGHFRLNLCKILPDLEGHAFLKFFGILLFGLVVSLMIFHGVV